MWNPVWVINSSAITNHLHCAYESPQSSYKSPQNYYQSPQSYYQSPQSAYESPSFITNHSKFITNYPKLLINLSPIIINHSPKAYQSLLFLVSAKPSVEYIRGPIFWLQKKNSPRNKYWGESQVSVCTSVASYPDNCQFELCLSNIWLVIY